jgi:hypothetical protein
MSDGGARMSGQGWAILFLLFFCLWSAAEWTFYVTLFVLGYWIWGRAKSTGDLPSVSKMIEDLFIEKKDPWE